MGEPTEQWIISNGLSDFLADIKIHLCELAPGKLNDEDVSDISRLIMISLRSRLNVSDKVKTRKSMRMERVLNHIIETERSCIGNVNRENVRDLKHHAGDSALINDCIYAITGVGDVF